MEAAARSGTARWIVLFAALPFALAGFVSAPASADQETSPATSIEDTEQESSSGPGTPPPSEPAEEPATTEVPAVEEPAVEEPAAEEPAAEDPVVEDSSTGTGPGSTEPQVAPSQAAGARQRARAPQPKVTICHRTNSRTNPYNEIRVSVESLIKQGHLTHTGPIFSEDVEEWGDIIPPIPPDLPGGMNWPEGQPVLNNSCEVPPDVGPLPSALIGEIVCDGATPSVDVTVTNGADATDPANFAILADGVVVETVGPVAPGGSQTVTLTGAADGLQEDATITVEVRSPPGGDVIATEVLTVDCADPPPGVDVGAELVCKGEVARGTVTVTNNGQQPVVVTARANGIPVGTPRTVAPGATETATADVSRFEDQTLIVEILVDGDVVATYTATPDCVAPQASPSVSVAGQECPPPPTSTVTLGNTGDPDSTVVFVILVDGTVVQRTAPLFGGDTTTIVGDLSQFEDQTVVVELRANGEVLDSRAIHVNCSAVAGAGAGASGSSAQPVVATGSGVLPGVGAAFGPSVIALGLGLVVGGALLIAVGSRRSRSRQA
jgi:hypothetical protein